MTRFTGPPHPDGHDVVVTAALTVPHPGRIGPAEETARRGPKVSAGTVFTGLHHGPDVWESTWAHISGIAALTQAYGRVAPRGDSLLLAGRQNGPGPGAEHADGRALIETCGERIGYLHLKQVDPEILAGVRANGIPFGPAVAKGVMCEPPAGVPALEPVPAAARKLEVDLFAIGEQDMYPCEPDRPLPIARRTRAFLRSCGA